MKGVGSTLKTDSMKPGCGTPPRDITASLYAKRVNGAGWGGGLDSVLDMHIHNLGFSKWQHLLIVWLGLTY